MLKLLRTILIFTLIAVLSIAAYVTYQLWRYEVFKTPVYEQTAPELPEMPSTTSVLLFSKTNSFRHLEAIPAAEALFQEFADKHQWDLFITENAAVHRSDLLNQFDLIVWNNVTGDVLTEAQRTALKQHMLKGGRFLALHGTGGNEHYDWSWFPKQLIKSQFIGHPMFPQFRDGTLTIENRTHPATAHLPETKAWHEEWYSFDTSPRDDVNVLISVDENGYDVPESLKMGEDHPLVWHHKVGDGTVFFSALGHLAEAYDDKEYQTLLENASIWLLHQ
ncbi:ThuA domain-containing protein [Pseudoteredinibacter isoporae]|uniref:ThuA domain-containing protein n=1 Tax=Pseudoteredinibacter isoporae TaxID=570281 RepID=UPI0031058C98